MTRGRRRTLEAFAGRVLGRQAPADRELSKEVERLLDRRPARERRGIAAFLALLRWAPALRWGRAFERLDAARQDRFLSWLQINPLLPLRLGLWGTRSLVLIAHYGAVPADTDSRLGCSPPGRGAAR